MGKKNKYVKPIWKYDHKIDTPTNDTKLVMLYHSQLFHKNFTSMRPNSQLLYIRMLDYSNGKQITTYPHKIYKDLMTKPTFIECIKELVEKGFIEVVLNGRFNKRENQYKFITKWCE